MRNLPITPHHYNIWIDTKVLPIPTSNIDAHGSWCAATQEAVDDGPWFKAGAAEMRGNGVVDRVDVGLFIHFRSKGGWQRRRGMHYH